MFLAITKIYDKICYLFTLIMPTSPPAMHENNTSNKKDTSIANDFAKTEKLTKATTIYKSPKHTPFKSPFDSPFIAIMLPIKTLIVFIAKFNGEIYFSSKENHFKQKASKIISPNEISIDTINPFIKLNIKLSPNLSDFANVINITPSKMYAKFLSVMIIILVYIKKSE